MATGLFTLRQQNQALRQGAWTGPQKTTWVEYLVVAGGGGGGCVGGGAGAGGLLTGIYPVITGTSNTVTIGAGGSGGPNTTQAGSNGVASVFGNISTTGGGGGGSNGSTTGPSISSGRSGGSGGGVGSAGIGGYSVGQGVSGQGNAGGNGLIVGTGYPSGGGGGAGTVGISGSGTTVSGNGGAGIASSITGTVVAYAGGGGGGSQGGTAGTGGVGGGGGGTNSVTTGATGGGNTGGGGGGGGYGGGDGLGGAGGSGIVIVSYPDVYAAPTSTTGSPTVSTSGSGSIYFDGSSQYMTFSSISGYQLNSGNFTVEGWINYSTATSYFTVAAKWSSSDLEYQFLVSTGNGQIFVDMSSSGSGTTTTLASTTGVISANTWNHVAWVRNGSTDTIYVNGTSVASGASGTIRAGTSVLTVGSRYPNGPLYGTGYISNTRIVKGTAVYTSAFTPSTIPLAPISGTSILLSTVSGARLADSSSNSAVATVSSTQPAWFATSPFATGSGYKNRVYTWTSSGSITF